MNIERRYIWLGGIVLVLSILLFFAYRERQRPEYIQTTTDRDTGETLYVEPNKTPEIAETGDTIAILGAQVLLDNGITQAQYALVRSSLEMFAKENLNNKYDRLAIVPEGASITGNTTVTTRLRLGNTSNYVGLEVRFWELQHTQVIIDAPEQYGGKYDSGVLSVPVIPNEHSVDE